MKFKIVYDKPCRIRFRCGNYAIPKEYEESIRFYISTSSFVKEVYVTSINGGILVMYKTGFRDKVVELVKNLNINTLAPMTEKREYGIKEIDKEFKDSLLKIALKRVFFKAFVPNPIATALTIYNSVKYIKNGLKALSECKLNVDVLDSASIVACFVRKNFKTASTVMFLLSISSLLEKYTRERTKAVLTDSLVIKTDKVWLVTSGEDVEIPITELQVGDKIRIHTGNVIPIDGIVEYGTTTLNTAALTGESLPRDAKEGDEVISGCINMTGLIKIKTTKEFGDSTVSKILDLVENSSSKKSRSENFITKFARYYTPAVCYGALALAVLPPIVSLIIGFDPAWNQWIYRALTFLVISCPCALVISIPLSFFAGIGGASKEGVLVKGSNYLEALSEAKYIVFDKTGTLTKGVFEVAGIHDAVIPEDKLLEYAAYAESFSSHPISRSLCKAYGKEIDQTRVSDVNEISGEGVTAVVDGTSVAAGNIKLMKRLGIECKECGSVGTVVHVAVNGSYAGHILISDQLKPHTKQALEELKKLGMKKLVMLTGDAKRVAESVAKEVELQTYTVNCFLPIKYQKLRNFLKRSRQKKNLYLSVME